MYNNKCQCILDELQMDPNGIQYWFILVLAVLGIGYLGILVLVLILDENTLLAPL